MRRQSSQGEIHLPQHRERQPKAGSPPRQKMVEGEVGAHMPVSSALFEVKKKNTAKCQNAHL